MVRKTLVFNNPGFEPDLEPTSRSASSKSIKSQSRVEPQKKIVVQSNSLTKEERIFKWGIIKNVIIISFAFTCLFTSFNSMVNLQSSINKKLGTTSLWVLYAALVFSCAFLPSFMIKKLKVKWTIAVSMLGYSTYMAAQFFPRYYTLLPSAIILGLGAAPMWSAKCTYLTVVGEKYGELVGENSEVIITRFFGIFFLFFQSSQVIGNLISSSVLSSGVDDTSRSDEFLDMCGANFCPNFAHNITASSEGGISIAKSPKDEHKIKVMSGIYLACALLSAVIIAVLVDNLSKYGEKERAENRKNKGGVALLMATFKHLKNPYQVLIIPLTFWSGVEQGFFGADFTAAFVSCGIGVHMVGYVMMSYGVCDAICSFGFSPLVKLIGRVPIFIFGAAVNVGVLILMFLWRPNPDELIVFFLMACLWGVADAIWQTQINAFYGVIFPGESEAAFSNYRLWESLGFILAYVMSSVSCLPTKLYLNLGVLAAGMAGYLAIEIWEKLRNID